MQRTKYKFQIVGRPQIPMFRITGFFRDCAQKKNRLRAGRKDCYLPVGAAGEKK